MLAVEDYSKKDDFDYKEGFWQEGIQPEIFQSK
jgi:hypothetical protein